MAAAPQLDAARIGRAVHAGIRECATTLRADALEAVRAAWLAARQADPDSRETAVLHAIVENALIGERDQVPICQDTGTVWVCLEVGEQACLPAGALSLVDDAVARAYEEGGLRMSVVRDALFDRANTQNNTPAFCEVRIVGGAGVRVRVMLKGGGSDNASRVVMLSPDEGAAGVRRVVLDCVREKAANACPPLIIGVGVGGTFDMVAGMAKPALLRAGGSPASSDPAAAFARELLDAVNATGIGPGALGGSCTALAVHLETAPCHIAALPVAVNMGCCAMRSATIELIAPDGTVLEQPAAQTWEGDDEMLRRLAAQEEAARGKGGAR